MAENRRRTDQQPFHKTPAAFENTRIANRDRTALFNGTRHFKMAVVYKMIDHSTRHSKRRELFPVSNSFPAQKFRDIFVIDNYIYEHYDTSISTGIYQMQSIRL